MCELTKYEREERILRKRLDAEVARLREALHQIAGMRWVYSSGGRAAPEGWEGNQHAAYNVAEAALGHQDREREHG